VDHATSFQTCFEQIAINSLSVFICYKIEGNEEDGSRPA